MEDPIIGDGEDVFRGMMVGLGITVGFLAFYAIGFFVAVRAFAAASLSPPLFATAITGLGIGFVLFAVFVAWAVLVLWWWGNP